MATTQRLGIDIVGTDRTKAAFQSLVRADLENFFRKVSAREAGIREVLAGE